MLRKGHFLAILVIGISITTVLSIQAQQDFNIPSWIKNTAGWWADGVISEDDFVNGIKWLVEHGIIRV